MVQQKLEEIKNKVRKFFPAKKEFLEKYLNSLKQIEQYELIKTIKSENEKNIKMIRKLYIDDEFEINVECFSRPIEFTLVEVKCIGNKALDEYKLPYGFIDVTENMRFENNNIYQGSIISSGNIIEGSDGVGKTTTIKELLKKGIVCQDRCMDVISPNMVYDVSLEERVKKYQEYLKKIDKKIIILVTRDKEELERRINSREKINEFDKYAYEYNIMYIDTFEYMKERNMLEGKLFMIDCTGLSIDEVTKKVEDILLG